MPQTPRFDGFDKAGGGVLGGASPLIPMGHLISLGVFNHETIYRHPSASPSEDAGIPSETISLGVVQHQKAPRSSLVILQ